MRLGGPADLFIECCSEPELLRALELIKAGKKEFFVLGGGTNLLVRDGGFRGTVIKLCGEYEKIEVSGNSLVCGAAAPLPLAVKAAAVAGLAGLETLSGIPGTVGGAVCGNSGTREAEIKDRLKSVTFFDEKKKLRSVAAGKLEFGYRTSEFKSRKVIITSAEFLLKKGKSQELKSAGAEIRRQKKNTQPLGQASAGCVFKNPAVGNPAGKLIEDSGLKGVKLGGASVSKLHANYIINQGKKASDMLALIAKIKKTVLEKKGVALEEEILILGEDL